ncbi:two-component system, response regulator YesN [Paenibacillus sp. UNCCL117]|uniref:response regulator transcription factor n=1 Tax=unclassified Paenibacillus TaxID=185978 RepID=UPI0008825FC8|nr:MULTISPECIES: response regulator transcription factor [unclassified Paenibacillus]SDC56036.1 two-component system, response regulator YesN [Paenibacillus sp. cl123]SFW10858.1 two-component system, response regulator YesN [Paenibacillus sp. UNCCL117]
MFKVMLVDDEPSIREGLRTLIDWERFGFRIAGDAHNGKQGLEQWAKVKPDLILTDIRMAGMDGLAMIEEIRKQDMRCQFILLTGYSDFQYAQRAIQYGVDSYLLKPVDPVELQDRLGRVYKQLSEELADQKQKASMLQLYHEELLQRIVVGNEGEEGHSAAVRELGLEWKIYRVLLVQLESSHPGSEEVAEKSKRAAKQQLQQAIANKGLGYVFTLEGFIAILLKEVLPAFIRPLLEETRNRGAAEYKTQMTVFIGHEVRLKKELPHSYRTALKLAVHAFIYRSGDEMMIADYDQASNFSQRLSASSETDVGEFFQMDQAVEKLMFAVEAVNRKLIGKILGDLACQLIRTEYSESRIKSSFALVYTKIIFGLSQTSGVSKESMVPFEKFEYQIDAYRCLATLLTDLENWLCEIADVVNVEGTDKGFGRMLMFIRRHYDKDLKLESLAEMFHYNSSYLGKLFKQQTGQYFNTYLDNLRIERAKELLLQGLKVHQVAKLVGYANVDYFHGKFKKYVGQSPSGYRDDSKL